MKAADECSLCNKRGNKRVDGIWYCKKDLANVKITETSIVKKSNSKTCKGDACDKRPSFAPTEGEPARRCEKCCADSKYDDWVNADTGRRLREPKTTSRKLPIEEKKRRQKLQHLCITEGCEHSKMYGYESDGKRLVCFDHIETLSVVEDDAIVNCISTRTCKLHKRIARFGYDETTHCFECKTDDMKKLTKLCEFEDCHRQPRFGIEWGKPTHCGRHQNEYMTDVKTKRCETCCSSSMSNVKDYKPNCARCHFYLNPDDPRIRNYKTKEHTFMIPLKDIYPDIVLDKKIDGGCSRRRPDGLIDVLTHGIVVEIDENSHVGYDSTCENRRMMEIFQDLGSRPVVIIRLNPDGYIENGKKIHSVFTKTTAGTLKVRYQSEFNRRFEKLNTSIKEAMHTIPNKTVTVIQLFFTEE